VDPWAWPGSERAGDARCSQFSMEVACLVSLPGARHTIFRDRPDLAFPAVRNFVSQVTASQAAS
jgi:hypothetical protein